MHRNGEQVELSTEEASAGTQLHAIRYVLGISLAITIIALALLWMSAAGPT